MSQRKFVERSSVSYKKYDKKAEKMGAIFSKPSNYWECVAGSTGLEPAASGVTGRRSNQTELRPPASGDMVGDTRIELVTYGL